MTDRDDIDPADWLSQQFGEQPEPVVPPPARRAPVPPSPAFVSPEVPPPTSPPLPQTDPFASKPPENGTIAATPFQWGLTPGDNPGAPDQPIVPAAPPLAPVPPPPQLPPPPPPLAPAAWPPPTQPATPLPPPASAGHADVPTQALDTTAWHTASVDPALEGVTEVIEAEIVGLATPQGEGVATSAIDNLFGDSKFQEYDDRALVVIPPRAPVSDGPRAALGTTQKVLLWVAGGLLAVLALVALFLVGKALSNTLGAAPAVIESATPSPSPTPTSTALPVGPVAPGEYQWDALLGGECLSPFTSAWQDSYTVVACSTPHPAQMIFRGTFIDAGAVAYPGVEELQKRMNELCTPTTVIDYSKAGLLSDVQVTASFAATADDWADGNRTFFCFVTRSGGQDFTESVAVPQVAPPR